MIEIESLLTERTRKLLQEVNDLKPEQPIKIEKMVDMGLLERSLGAATSGDTIFLDLSRANEMMLAHELMHLQLHRSGWAQMFSLGHDDFPHYIVDYVDNVVDHIIFIPRLNKLGFDLYDYKEGLLNGSTDWKQQDVEGENRIIKATLIMETLQFGSPYREKIINATKDKYRYSLSLALELDKLIPLPGERSKPTMRRAMVQILDHLDNNISQISKTPIKLKQWILVTPLFSKMQLENQADKTLFFMTANYCQEHQIKGVASIRLIADKSVIRNYTYDPKSTPKEIQSMKTKLRAMSLGVLLQSEGIEFGLI
jgi:hypothetical protein